MHAISDYVGTIESFDRPFTGVSEKKKLVDKVLSESLSGLFGS